MIEISFLIEKLKQKLNNNLNGLKFAIKLDTGEITKPKRIPNTNSFEYPINGLVKIISNDVNNLVDGEVFATISARLQVSVPLNGDEKDKEFSDGINTKTVLGYGNKVKAVRKTLTDLFSRAEQEIISDSDEKFYSVTTVYAFPNSGERNIVFGGGDSLVLSVIISYMIVENGINTYDVIYTLDGKQIPFQANTVFRTPTMEGNVFGDTANGAVKNTSMQTSFSISFELPALKNEITAQMFEYLFGGQMNVAHILNIKYPSFGSAEKKEKNYLVSFGEVKAMGNMVQNIGQTLTLVECDDDYELLEFPDNYYIYECTNATDSEVFGGFAYFYNAETKEFGNGLTGNLSFAVGDILISTAPLSDSTNFTQV